MHTNFRVREILLIVTCLLLAVQIPALAQISGTKIIAPTGGDYTTIAAAIADMQTNTISGPVVLELDDSYNPTAETYPLRLPGIAGTSGTNTITIRPAANVVAAKTFSNSSDTTVNMCGGNFYKIDGRKGGIGNATDTFIRIINTNGNGIAVGLTLSASNNVISYCMLRGVRTVNFGSTIQPGCDNNTLSYCYITGFGNTKATYCVFMQATAPNRSNDNNAIMNCNLFNFNNGINCEANNNGSIIRANSMYQTVATNTARNFIYITAGTPNISNNFLGGSAPECAGVATPMTTSSTQPFYFIYCSTGNVTLPGTVKKNKIANVNILSANGTVEFIKCLGGPNTDTNTIGSVSATPGSDTVAVRQTGFGTSTVRFIIAEAGTIRCNNAGSIKLYTNQPAAGITCSVITATATINSISYNTIGGTLANSIDHVTANTGGLANSISGIVAPGGNTYVENNTICNIRNASTGTAAHCVGIFSNTSLYVRRNTVFNISNATTTTNTNTAIALSGITIFNTSNASNVEGNKVYGLSNVGGLYVAGIHHYTAGTQSHTVTGNLVHSISTGTPGSYVFGILLNSQAAAPVVRVANNMIRLGIDVAGVSLSTSAKINGIAEMSATNCTNNIYNNTIYIGGSAVTGADSSAALVVRDANAVRHVKNNIAVNARSNGSGTGMHYCISTNSTLTNTMLDTNLYHYSGTGGALGYYGAPQATLGNWQSASLKDVASLFADPALLNPTGDSSTLDLHLNYASPADGAGSYNSVVTTDYDGQNRVSLTPSDIGADAGDYAGILWLGGTSTTWSNGSNWQGGVVPASNQRAAVIKTGVTYQPELTTSTTVAHFAIKGGNTLTINNGVVLSVTGKLDNNATITGDGAIALTGTSAQSISGVGTISNLTLNNNGASIATASQVYLTGVYTPTKGTLTTNGRLTLKSTDTTTARVATGSASGGYISGNVTVERYIPGGRRAYRFLGHPFSIAIALSQLTDDIDITGAGGAANGFKAIVSTNASAYYYDPAQSNGSATNDAGWQPFTSANTNSWGKFKGIRVLVRGTIDEGIPSVYPYTPSAVTLDMVGPLNQGTQNIPLTSATNSGFNVVSNPFASPIIPSVGLSGAANISGSVYWVWNPMSQGVNGKGAYVAYPKSSSANVLPAGSAFLVKVTANTTLTIAESAKAATPNASVFKETGIQDMAELHIVDTAGDYYDRVYIVGDAAANDSMEQADGGKFNNPNVNFYTLSGSNDMLSLDARPFANGKLIPLGFITNELKRYVIQTKGFTVQAGTQLYLHDKYLKIKSLLSQGAQYAFDVTTDSNSQGNNRFEIGVFVPGDDEPEVTGVSEVATTQLQVTASPNPANDYVDIEINAATKAHTIVTITSIEGVLLYKLNAGVLARQTVRVPITELNAGLYLVQVRHGKEVVSGRIVKQ